MNRHWAKKAYQTQDLHDVSSLQEGGVSIPQPNGVEHAEIMRPSASIEPGPLLHEVDSLGGFDPVSNFGRPTPARWRGNLIHRFISAQVRSPAKYDHHQRPPYINGR